MDRAGSCRTSRRDTRVRYRRPARSLDRAAGRYPEEMHRSRIVEVLEVGEVTIADVVAAATEGSTDYTTDERVSPVEETPVVRA